MTFHLFSRKHGSSNNSASAQVIPTRTLPYTPRQADKLCRTLMETPLQAFLSFFLFLSLSPLSLRVYFLIKSPHGTFFTSSRTGFPVFVLACVHVWVVSAYVRPFLDLGVLFHFSFFLFRAAVPGWRGIARMWERIAADDESVEGGRERSLDETMSTHSAKAVGEGSYNTQPARKTLSRGGAWRGCELPGGRTGRETDPILLFFLSSPHERSHWSQQGAMTCAAFSLAGSSHVAVVGGIPFSYTMNDER